MHTANWLAVTIEGGAAHCQLVGSDDGGGVRYPLVGSDERMRSTDWSVSSRGCFSLSEKSPSSHPEVTRWLLLFPGVAL
jgi:hypothetical protein